MAFPIRMMSEKADCIEAEIDTSAKKFSFIDYMNVVSIYSEVDCYVKFNDESSKPFPHLAKLVYTWFFPIKELIVYSVSEKGKFYAWGEKV